jgi:hypothetical protein
MSTRERLRAPDHHRSRRALLPLALALGLASIAQAADQPPADLAQFTSVDLKPFVNMAWKDDVAGDGVGGWTDQGSTDMREVVPGDKTFLGIPFTLIDPAANHGKAVLTLKSRKFNAGVVAAEIPVGAKATGIYFLHASAWTGGRMATYTVEYEDGTSIAIPIRAKEEITDWWAPQNGNACRVAFHVPNPVTDDLGMVIFGWNNPDPAKTIARLRIASDDQDGIVVLAGITLSQKPISLPDPKDIPLPDYLQSDLPTLDATQWFPVENKKDPFAETCIDQQPKLDLPAGKHGFMKTVDGRWAFADGTPCRMVGTMGNPPRTKEEAAYFARFLAKYGFTLIRMGHFVDGPSEESVVDWHRADTQHLDPGYMDRLDYFINELAKNGIYTRISTFWYRKMKAGDGIAGFDEAMEYQAGKGKRTKNGDELLNTCGITFYHPDVIKRNIDLELALMTHHNPYRDNRPYGEDPAIAQIEVTNEDGVFFYSFDHPAPPFARMLDARWTAWLTKKYGNEAGLARAWGDELGGSESLAGGNIGRYSLSSLASPSAMRRPTRLHDQMEFYAELQNGYFIQTRDALRQAGVQQPLCGSGWFGAGNAFFADIWANAKGLDYIDRHQYWAGGPGGWQILAGMTFETQCALTKPELLLKLGGERVVGMPFTISEWANVLPNQFRLEAPPLMAFYGNELGGWDAPLHFAWGDPGSFTNHLKWMWPVNEPSTLCQYPMLAQMIRAHDLKEGPDAFIRNLSDAKTLSGQPLGDVLVRLDISGPFEKLSGTQGASARSLAAVYAGAVGRTGIAFTGSQEKPDYSIDLNRYIDAEQRVIHAATGELTWDYGRGVVTASAPKMQAAVGFLPKETIPLPDCDITVDNPIASVLVTPLDDAPLATSKHLLITAVGRSRNTDMAYSRGGQRLIEIGKPPVLLEGLRGSVALHRTGACTVAALDPWGYKTVDVQPVVDGDRISIPLDGKNHAAYYEVRFEGTP